MNVLANGSFDPNQMIGPKHVMQTREHYLFAGLSEAQFYRISRSIRACELTAGELLFRRGERATRFFMLRKGSVALYRFSAEGQEKVMRFIQPGQTFAESVMFMDNPRYPVDARGEQDSRLLAVDAKVYFGLMRDNFDTCRAIFVRMNERIQTQWDEIEALSLQNSRYRVVHYLLGLCPHNAGSGAACVTLPARKALIAAQLAVTPETLSRVLRELSNQGLIDMEGYDLRVSDVAALRRQIN